MVLARPEVAMPPVECRAYDRELAPSASPIGVGLPSGSKPGALGARDDTSAI